MYNDHVTVFNFYESPTTGEITWYPHVLQMCDLIADHGAIIKKYGADSTDTAQLHVRWYDADEEIYAYYDPAVTICRIFHRKNGRSRPTISWRNL